LRGSPGSGEPAGRSIAGIQQSHLKWVIGGWCGGDPGRGRVKVGGFSSSG